MQLSARTIEDRRFSTAIKGYRKAEVDAFLTESAAYVSRLEEDLAIARTRAEKAVVELTDLRAHIDQELDRARVARQTILEEARAEAAAIVAAAGQTIGGDAARGAPVDRGAGSAAVLTRDEADAIIERARADADRIVEQARSTATTREAEADRVLAAARAESQRLAEETRSYRAEMEANLAEIKRILESTRRSAGETPSVELGDDGAVVVDLRANRAPSAVTET